MRVMDEKKLQEITEFIKRYARENNGDAPGLADIMDYMNMAKTTAYRYMLENSIACRFSVVLFVARPTSKRSIYEDISPSRRIGSKVNAFCLKPMEIQWWISVSRKEISCS